jgi:hypothetical protein
MHRAKASLRDWKRGFSPLDEALMDRPSILLADNQSDHKLLEHLRAARRYPTVGENIALLEAFGKWRVSVLWWETHAEGCIVSLLRLARTFYAIGELDKYAALVTYAAVTFMFHINVDDPPPSYAEINRIADRFSKRPDMLPDRLRYEGGRMPTKKTKSRDDIPEQIGIDDGGLF